MDTAKARRPTRVVILGGGFGGVYTAQNLSRMLGNRTDVEVELLCEENYFVFQPLLPEVAAGGIAATHVVNPIRELVPRARFRCCRVVSVDLEQKCVFVSQGEGLRLVTVPYDHLVFCLGKITSFASMPGVAEQLGILASLGQRSAVAELFGVRLEPGEDIVREGQVGREFYVTNRKRPGGDPCRRPRHVAIGLSHDGEELPDPERLLCKAPRAAPPWRHGPGNLAAGSWRGRGRPVAVRGLTGIM